MLAAIGDTASFEDVKALMKSMKPQLAPGQPKPPVLPTPELSVGGISSLGIVAIAFSSPMEVPKEYKKRSRILSQVEDDHCRFLKKVEDAIRVTMIGN